jgi:hypothetical protein
LAASLSRRHALGFKIMNNISISDDARQFLISYSYFVRDPYFFPDDSEAGRPDRFRIRRDEKAWFRAGDEIAPTSTSQSVWINLRRDVLIELIEADFLRLISSGEHFVTDEGWSFIRDHIAKLNYTS